VTHPDRDPAQDPQGGVAPNPHTDPLRDALTAMPPPRVSPPPDSIAPRQGPEHDRLHGIIQRALTRSAVEADEEAMRKLARDVASRGVAALEPVRQRLVALQSALNEMQRNPLPERDAVVQAIREHAYAWEDPVHGWTVADVGEAADAVLALVRRHRYTPDTPIRIANDQP
jgi:cytochrome P450